jgi:hypothetical protein
VTRRRGLLLAAAALPLCTAACGIQSSGITVLGVAPQGPSAVAATIPTTVAGESTFALLFYQNGELEPVYRTAAKSTLDDMTVVDALRAGPSKVEIAEGYYSALPGSLVISPKSDDQAWAYGFSETINQAALAQFVCTVQIFSQTQVGWKDLSKGGGSPLSWVGCSDTTRQYIPLLSNDDQGLSSITASPSPSP